MSDLEAIDFDEEAFSGCVRLFPLPNLVLFPHVMQPLHVFEPRYRELVEDALAHDRLITMALLKAGWEPGYEDRPPIHSTACLGQIVKHHRQPDGRFNLLVVGLRRVRIIRELPPERSFRQADVALLADCGCSASSVDSAKLRRELKRSFRRLVPSVEEAQEQFEQLLGGDISLGILTDVVSYALNLGLNDKIELLAETDIEARARRLIAALETMTADRVAPDSQAEFPPRFSPN